MLWYMPSNGLSELRSRTSGREPSAVANHSKSAQRSLERSTGQLAFAMVRCERNFGPGATSGKRPARSGARFRDRGRPGMYRINSHRMHSQRECDIQQAPGARDPLRHLLASGAMAIMRSRSYWFQTTKLRSEAMRQDPIGFARIMSVTWSLSGGSNRKPSPK